MTLNVNDTILYGMDGVCTVVGKTEMEYGGESNEYYVLESHCRECYKIYVPVDSETVREKVRSILSVDEILELIETLPDEDTVWVEDNNARRNKFQKMLTSGDRTQLVKLIKTIHLQDQKRKSEGKKLYLVDERVLKDAEKILYEEFAHVLDIHPDEVLPFIIEQLDLKGKTF